MRLPRLSPISEKDFFERQRKKEARKKKAVEDYLFLESKTQHDYHMRDTCGVSGVGEYTLHFDLDDLRKKDWYGE